MIFNFEVVGKSNNESRTVGIHPYVGTVSSSGYKEGNFNVAKLLLMFKNMPHFVKVRF